MASTGRRDNRSAEAQAYRPLYKTARWRCIRADQLAKQPLCETCLSMNRITAATVCNHADKDSKRTEEGFFAGPFTSECAPCHDGLIQSQERRGHQIGCDATGLPLDPNHHWNR
ncbi:MAG: HNH endonuclease [Brevundimonas sp.]|nr:MAG: HNH endonuclease [Brevundimonas sp.]